jgi:hypothetical protein
MLWLVNLFATIAIGLLASATATNGIGPTKQKNALLHQRGCDYPDENTRDCRCYALLQCSSGNAATIHVRLCLLMS